MALTLHLVAADGSTFDLAVPSPIWPYIPPTPSALLEPGVDYQVGVEPFNAPLTVVTPNMQIPGTSLTSDARGSIVVTTANTTLRRFHLPTGNIQVKAANCLVDQCDVDGWDETTQTAVRGLVDGNNQAATGLVVRDTTLIPAVPGAAWNGVMGHDYQAIRVKVRNTVDCFSVYNANAGHTTDPVHVLLDGVDGDEMVFVSPDANHSGDSPVSHTHNDFCQIQGAAAGSVVEIRYSSIRAFLSTKVGDALYSPTNHNSRGGWNNGFPGTQSTSGLMLTPNIAPITGVNMHDNFGDGGQVFVNGLACTSACTGLSFTNNKHTGHNTVYQGQAYSVTAVAGAAFSANTYVDTGATLVPYRS